MSDGDWVFCMLLCYRHFGLSVMYIEPRSRKITLRSYKIIYLAILQILAVIVRRSRNKVALANFKNYHTNLSS